MKFLVRVLSPLVIFVSWVNVVTSQGELTFDVVSIKENRGGTAGGASITPRSFAFLSITPAGLIRWAYDLSEREVVGGPEWIDTVRFTVRGTTTRDTRVPEFREMVKSVLRTRFRMDAEFETQEDQPIYRLTLVHADGRLGPAMSPSQVGCQRDGTIVVSNEPAAFPQNCSLGTFFNGQGLTAIVGLNTTMKELARTLSRRQEFGRPVFDFTGLEGEYNFSAQLSKRGPDQAAPADPVAISAGWFSALSEQLGLRLQASRGPVRVLRVRSIERPTAD
jgi:uncharacterized protein (TIGR03435 family)